MKNGAAKLQKFAAVTKIKLSYVFWNLEDSHRSLTVKQCRGSLITQSMIEYSMATDKFDELLAKTD